MITEFLDSFEARGLIEGVHNKLNASPDFLIFYVKFKAKNRSGVEFGQVAPSEPPRVRAILGAIGEQLDQSESWLLMLRKGLNPLSRFDFGNLCALEYARKWHKGVYSP